MDQNLSEPSEKLCTPEIFTPGKPLINIEITFDRNIDLSCHFFIYF
jgi:hypothetical protein